MTKTSQGMMYDQDYMTPLNFLPPLYFLGTNEAKHFRYGAEIGYTTYNYCITKITRKGAVDKVT